MVSEPFTFSKLRYVSPKLGRIFRLWNYLKELGLELEVTLGERTGEREGAPLFALEGETKAPNFSPEDPSSLFYTPNKPLAARLPFHYHAIPWFARVLIRNLLYRNSGDGRGRFEQFKRRYLARFVNLESLLARDLEDLNDSVVAPKPYPDNKEFAFLITHDVDTAYGQRAVSDLLEIEEELKLRSCLFVVPNSFRLADSMLESWAARGHEIACHDTNHDNHLAFLSPDDIRERFNRSEPFLRRFGVKGFRAGSFLRTKCLLEVVAERFLYDSSVPEKRTSPYENGCFRQRPFRILERLIEIPVTFPADGELLSQGFSTDQIFELWTSKLKLLSLIGGCAVLLTHPEKGFCDTKEMKSVYRRFLEHVVTHERAWCGLPRDLAVWSARAEEALRERA